jgi:hypothetical protein
MRIQDVTSFLDTRLTPNTSYTSRVRAVDASGNSPTPTVDRPDAGDGGGLTKRDGDMGVACRVVPRRPPRLFQWICNGGTPR